MSSRIEFLTEAQRDRFPEFVDKWTRIGLCTDPADQPRAEAGIAACYRAAGLEPVPITWVGSPLVAVLSGPTAEYLLSDSAVDSAVRLAVRSAVRSAVDSAVDSAVGSAVRSDRRSAINTAVRSAWHLVFGGQFWAAWPAYQSFIRDACRLDLVPEMEARAAAYQAVVESACWWWPGRRTCFISDRPSLISLADRPAGRVLHNESGPAVEFRDGWRIWALDGIRVDEQLVMRPGEQTLKQIDGETNADLRAVRISRFGWPRYLRESGAECLDTRDNGLEGTIEALYATKSGERRLVATCPTGRTFAMGCPAEVRTCEQAQRWLSPRPIRVLART